MTSAQITIFYLNALTGVAGATTGFITSRTAVILGQSAFFRRCTYAFGWVCVCFAVAVFIIATAGALGRM